jgi:prepilin-type N-terminal cleavage/methylation domain-containing protein
MRSCVAADRNVRAPGATWQAFSLLELLVVVVMLAVLALIATPAICKTKPNGRAMQCLNNNRRLCAAWRMYSEDNHGLIVYASDDGTLTQNPLNQYAWTQSHLDYNPANRSNWDPTVGITPSPLWPYCGQRFDIWKCPSDRSSVVVSGVRKPRVRTMAMNLYLGGFAGTTGGFAWIVPYKIYFKTSEITPPAKIFVFLDMREDAGPLWGNFLTGMQGYSPPSPASYEIADFPGFAHEMGCGFSFADGHTEIRHWLDRRTTPPFGSVLSTPIPSPRNSDVGWLQDHATRLK